MGRWATYRLQFRDGFGFDEAAAAVPYLRRLGVSTVYASPLLRARAGSAHGYDVVDPTALDPALGGEEAFARFVAALREAGIGLLLDIVPNHMAASLESPWWREVLWLGRGAPSARVFDIDWDAGDGRVLLPVLGEPVGDALAARALRTVARDDGLAIAYGDDAFPVAPWSYARVVPALADLAETARAASDEKLVAVGEEVARAFSRARDREVDRAIERINGDVDALEDLLDDQPYRLAHWRLANHELNRRRFFDITELVAVRVEDPEVFERTHATVLRLVRDGVVDGLRVDHVDGLADPGAYLVRLRARVGPAHAIVVEKILERDERLPTSWPVDGTTGYETIAAIDGLFVEPGGLERLARAFGRFTGEQRPFGEVVREAKRHVLTRLFGAEVRVLATAAAARAAEDRRARDLAEDAIRAAIVETIAALPTYRTDEDPAPLRRAVREARARLDADGARAAAYLERVVAGADPADARLRARWHQLTGPAMAKGFEDTALYRWMPLAALCEVGGWPAETRGVEGFHALMRARLPGSLTPGTTHDTKRAEDVRARLLALSEVPARFERFATRWGRDAGIPPDVAWLLLQTLLGTWRGRAARAYARRIAGYMRKAEREAKRHTDWLEPDAAHERAVERCVRRLLRDEDFVADLDAFARDLARRGAVTSLAQVAIRCAAPGITDVYQGSEVWDLRLVDPDNRGRVDLAARARMLDRVDALGARDALRGLEDGSAKLWALRRGLAARAADPALFVEGAYVPLRVEGARAANVVAFARRLEGRWAACVVPRLTGARIPLGARAWGDTAVVLPRGAPRVWRSAYGDDVEATSGRLSVARALAAWPAAILSGPRGRTGAPRSRRASASR